MFTTDGNNLIDYKYHVLVPEVDITAYNIMFYNFKKYVHIYHNSTEPGCRAIYSNGATGGSGVRQGLNFVKTCLSFTQNGKNNIIRDNWMLLHTSITEIIANNELFVTDVHQCLSDDFLTVPTNGSLQVLIAQICLSFSPLSTRE